VRKDSIEYVFGHDVSFRKGGTVLSSGNPVERLIEVAIVIVTLGLTVYLLGWSRWLW
jgi:hypothetical protein